MTSRDTIERFLPLHLVVFYRMTLEGGTRLMKNVDGASAVNQAQRQPVRQHAGASTYQAPRSVCTALPNHINWLR